MYRTFLSLRYLRARRTSWIGVAGIFVAVGALILILSIMSGFLSESRSVLRGSLADVVIQPQFELPGRDGAPLDPDGEEMLEIVRADPRVAGACLQLQWGAILGQEGKGYVIRDPQYFDLTIVRVIGIDIEDEFEASELLDALTAETRLPVQRVADPGVAFAPPPGYDPEERDSRPLERAIVGEQLAYNWGIDRGDEIELQTTAYDPDTGSLGDPSNQRFVVAGTFRTGENEADLQRIYLDRRVLADFLGGARDYSALLVRLEDYDRDAEAFVPEIHEKLFAAGLLHDPRRSFGEVRTWEQFNSTWLAAVENEKVLMGIMLSLVMVVAGFTVFAILSMMVTEKRRDVGVLCALGAPPRGVLLLFLAVGFWQAFIGATAGTIAGVWAALEIDAIEAWLSRTLGVEIFNRNVYYFDRIPSVVEPFGVAMIVSGAFACALLFAAFPAWKAARLSPIDALRYE